MRQRAARGARRNLALPLAAALLVAACAGGLARPQRAADAQDEVGELKARVLELQRKAAINEVELDRLRQRVAELEAKLGLGVGPRPGAGAPTPLNRTAAPALPPADREPEPRPPAPPTPLAAANADRRPPVVIEERDLDEPPPPPAEPPATTRGAEVATPPGAAPPAAPLQPVTPAAQALYDRGYTLFHQGKFVDAESSFQRFIQSYPSTDLTDNA